MRASVYSILFILSSCNFLQASELYPNVNCPEAIKLKHYNISELYNKVGKDKFQIKTNPYVHYTKGAAQTPEYCAAVGQQIAYGNQILGVLQHPCWKPETLKIWTGYIKKLKSYDYMGCK